MSDAERVLFLAVIDFDLPSVEIDLQEGLCVIGEIGGEQIGGVSLMQLAALAFAIGRGRNDDEPQRQFARASSPVEVIDLFVGHDAPFAAAEEFGGAPGDAVVFAHLLGGELVDVVKSARTRRCVFARLGVLAGPFDAWRFLEANR